MFNLEFMRMNLGACFGLGLVALDTANQDHDQRISLELDVSRGGGGGGVGSRRNVAGTFLQTKSINESSLNNLMYSEYVHSHWYRNIFLKSKLLKILPVIILS